MSTAEDKRLTVWELEQEKLLKVSPPTSSVYYKNAKVALIGDSGVGKSGLALVLTGHKFRPTESTHARKVRSLRTQRIKFNGGTTEIREIVLWDLAGQPGYRLIHQLHLQDIAVALIVFDSKSELDPFAGVRHWNRAYLQAKRFGHSVGDAKILVAARVDRGSVGVSKARLAAILEELSLAGYLETSAKEGVGIDELRKKIDSAVDWDALPTVTSNRVFQRFKTFVAEQRSRGKILISWAELVDAFQTEARLKAQEPQPERSDFETYLGRLQSLGVVRVFSFGGLVLLRPEILDSYAAAIIFAAKNEPDGMGSILEEDVRNAAFQIPGDERLKDKSQEKLLLLATTEDLITHEIALRESAEDGQLLVFPSQLTRENPELPDPPGKEVVYNFQGSVQSIYATLVVRLAHSNIFRLKELWKNAATFDPKYDKLCGLYLTEVEEGHASLTLFYEPGTSSTTRHQFEDYVFTHLLRRSVPNSVSSRRALSCPTPDCATPITDTAVQKRRERGFDWISCNVCGANVPLGRIPTVPAGPAASTRDIDRAAASHSALDAALVSASAEIQTLGFSQWAGADRTTVALVFTDVVGSTSIGDEVGDEEMSEIRRAHFDKARQLIRKHKGYGIKTIGDALMVAFRTAVHALNFALEVNADTGHPRIQVRVGIHVGPIHVEEEDAFGNMVNYAARVVHAATGPEIWTSDRARSDIQAEKSRQHENLIWTSHEQDIKGFRGKQMLWSVHVPGA